MLSLNIRPVLERAAVAVLILVMAVSCKDNRKFLTYAGEETVSFTSAGGPGRLTFNAYAPWTIQCSEDWISVSSPTGADTGEGITVGYGVAQNVGTDDRTAKITISSDGVDVTITVNQEKKRVISLEETDLELDDMAQSFTLGVSSNVEYEVTSNAAWVRPEDTKALKKSEIRFSVDANDGTSTRIAVLSFRDLSSSMVSRIIVNQKGAPAIMDETACGIYDSVKPVLRFSGNGSQEGVIASKTEVECHLVNAKTREYCLFRGIPADVLEMNVGDEFSMDIEHNTNIFNGENVRINVILRKKEDGKIWCWDRENQTGIIIRAE